MSDVLSRFPKARPELPGPHRVIYEEEYKSNRGEGTSLLHRAVLWLESWMHRQMTPHGTRLLEIGAGTLNHVPFEAGWDTYDIVEPFEALYAQSPELQRVSATYADLAAVPAEQRYDRILSVAVLEHLTHLPDIVARAGLLLADGGRFQAGIPSEGGLLWGLSWRMSTGISYRLRTGLDYGTLMRHEHVNTAAEIEAVVREFFEDVSRRRFPLPVLHGSFYTYLEATRPRRDRCEAYLAGGSSQG